MLREHIDGFLDVVVELHLAQHRIGAQVDQPSRRDMFGQRRRPAMQVDEKGRRPIELPKRLVAHPVAAAIGVQGMERPPPAQIEAPHDVVDERRRQERAVIAVAHEHLRRRAVRLDVVGFVSKPLQPNQVLHRQPDDSGHGMAAHHAEDDDLPPHADASCASTYASAGGGVFRARSRACISWSCL